MRDLTISGKITVAEEPDAVAPDILDVEKIRNIFGGITLHQK
jgi:hypothetical protein